MTENEKPIVATVTHMTPNSQNRGCSMNKLATKEGYRHFLSLELAERKERNPSYSLRAFARDLHLSPSFLCDVLSNKCHLSLASATKVGQYLGLKDKTLDNFIGEVKREIATPSRASRTLHAAATHLLSVLPYEDAAKAFYMTTGKKIKDYVDQA